MGGLLSWRSGVDRSMKCRKSLYLKILPSIGKYGLKKFKLDTYFLQDPNFAEVFSEVIRDIVKDDREGISFEIYQRPAVQFILDIMHEVDFTSAALDIDDTYYITGYEHQWNRDTGQDTRTTVWMHKVITDDTSITNSEVETEIEVPLGFGSPAGDPGSIGGSGGGGNPGYIFIPALGGNTSPRARVTWHDGVINQDVIPHGVPVQSSGDSAAGMTLVPVGVSTLELYPILRVSSPIPTGNTKIYFEAVVYPLNDSGAYTDADTSTVTHNLVLGRNWLVDSAFTLEVSEGDIVTCYLENLTTNPGATISCYGFIGIVK